MSRRYEVSFQDNVLTWWRDAPGFSQRVTLAFGDGDNVIIGKGELCRDGETWEADLSQTFVRVR